MTMPDTRACTAQLTIESPLGPMLIARTARGLGGIWFTGQKHHPAPMDLPEAPEDPLLQRVSAQLRAYFDGEPLAFDVPLDLHGTPFQRRVWDALLRIPRGETRTYGEIAAELGSPAAVRAVGGAVGRNPVTLIVPCHRVIGRDGSLTGYAGGIHRKTALLRIEHALDGSLV